MLPKNFIQQYKVTATWYPETGTLHLFGGGVILDEFRGDDFGPGIDPRYKHFAFSPATGINYSCSLYIPLFTKEFEGVGASNYRLSIYLVHTIGEGKAFIQTEEKATIPVYVHSVQPCSDAEKAIAFGRLVDCMIAAPGMVDYVNLSCGPFFYSDEEMQRAKIIVANLTKRMNAVHN